MSDPLVNPQDVQGILPTLDPRINPQPFIDAAHAMMSQHMIGQSKIVNADGSDNTELLTQIELWLAAHFCAVADPIHSNESGVGASAARALPSMGEGLEATFPGRQVMALDYSATLSPLFLKRRPIVFAPFGTGGQCGPVRVIQT